MKLSNIGSKSSFKSRCTARCGLLLALMLMLPACVQNDFELLDGEGKRLEDYHGRWLVVNFWAEWCKPCLEEIPELNQLASQDDSVAVIGISYDRLTNQKLRELRDKLAIDYPLVATDPQPYFPFSLPDKLPANFLISPAGEIHGPLLGTQSAASLTAAIELLEAQTSEKPD